jgi:hypothetical protein
MVGEQRLQENSVLKNHPPEPVEKLKKSACGLVLLNDGGHWATFRSVMPLPPVI